MLNIYAFLLVVSCTICHVSCQTPSRPETCLNTSAINQKGEVVCARANCTVQSLSLPVYSQFNSSSNFQWQITGMPDFRIIVQFIVYGVKSCCNFFEITETGMKSSESLSGRLQIDPLFSRDPLILTYISQTDAVLVRVPSNLSKNFDSVKATYQITEEYPFNYTSPYVRESWISTQADCGYNLTAGLEIQNITTPGWPSPSGIINNRHCKWTINGDPGSRIYLRFTYFKTEGCCDFVEISEIGNLSVRLSGNLRRGYNYVSTRNLVTVRFISDANTKSRGFFLQYQLTTSMEPHKTYIQSQELVPCQLIAYASHTPQPLTSPGWPQPYFQNLDCKWVLNGRRGFRIMIQILALDIGEQTLQFREEGRVLNEVQGQSVQTYISSARSVLLRFRTRRSRKGIGFYATFQLTSLFPNNATDLTAAMQVNQTDHIIRFQENCETITNPENATKAPLTTASEEETELFASTQTITSQLDTTKSLEGLSTTYPHLEDVTSSTLSTIDENPTNVGIILPATASTDTIFKPETTAEELPQSSTTTNPSIETTLTPKQTISSSPEASIVNSQVATRATTHIDTKNATKVPHTSIIEEDLSTTDTHLKNVTSSMSSTIGEGTSNVGITFLATVSSDTTSTVETTTAELHQSLVTTKPSIKTASTHSQITIPSLVTSTANYQIVTHENTNTDALPTEALEWLVAATLEKEENEKNTKKPESTTTTNFASTLSTLSTSTIAKSVKTGATSASRTQGLLSTGSTTLTETTVSSSTYTTTASILSTTSKVSALKANTTMTTLTMEAKSTEPTTDLETAFNNRFSSTKISTTPQTTDIPETVTVTSYETLTNDKKVETVTNSSLSQNNINATAPSIFPSSTSTYSPYTIERTATPLKSTEEPTTSHKQNLLTSKQRLTTNMRSTLTSDIPTQTLLNAMQYSYALEASTRGSSLPTKNADATTQPVKLSSTASSSQNTMEVTATSFDNQEKATSGQQKTTRNSNQMTSSATSRLTYEMFNSNITRNSYFTDEMPVVTTEATSLSPEKMQETSPGLLKNTTKGSENKSVATESLEVASPQTTTITVANIPTSVQTIEDLEQFITQPLSTSSGVTETQTVTSRRSESTSGRKEILESMTRPHTVSELSGEETTSKSVRRITKSSSTLVPEITDKGLVTTKDIYSVSSVQPSIQSFTENRNGFHEATQRMENNTATETQVDTTTSVSSSTSSMKKDETTNEPTRISIVSPTYGLTSSFIGITTLNEFETSAALTNDQTSIVNPAISTDADNLVTSDRKSNETTVLLAARTTDFPISRETSTKIYDPMTKLDENKSNATDSQMGSRYQATTEMANIFESTATTTKNMEVFTTSFEFANHKPTEPSSISTTESTTDNEKIVESTTNSIIDAEVSSNTTPIRMTTISDSEGASSVSVTETFHNKMTESIRAVSFSPPSFPSSTESASEFFGSAQSKSTNMPLHTTIAILAEKTTNTPSSTQYVELTTESAQAPTDTSIPLLTGATSTTSGADTTATTIKSSLPTITAVTDSTASNAVTREETAEKVTLGTTERSRFVTTINNITDNGIITPEAITITNATNVETTSELVLSTRSMVSTIPAVSTTPTATLTKSQTRTSNYVTLNGTIQPTEATKENIVEITPAEIVGFANQTESTDPILIIKNPNTSIDFCYSQSYAVYGERVSFETTPLHELALSEKRCNGTGRPYGVVRCTQNDATGNQSIAEFDEKSLYVVPCNVTLDYLVAVASGSVNSTLKMLPALMVLTSFPETFEAHDVTSALLALSQFYPKAAAKKIEYQELVSVIYTIGKLAARSQNLPIPNARVTGMMSDLLSTLHQYISILVLNDDRVNILTNAVDVQVMKSYPKNQAQDFSKLRYYPVKFNFTDRRTMKGISLLLPPASIRSVAQQLETTNPVFFASILNKLIRLDPSQNTSRIISIGLASSNRSAIKFGINFEDLVITDSISPSKHELKRKLNKQKLVEWNYAKDDWNLANQCEMLQKTNQSTQYECPKFASYAILFSSTTIPSVVVLTRVSYVGCLLSVLFLIATILINVIPKKLRTKSTTPTLINICVCLALVYIFFVFGIGLTADKTVCDAMTFLLHYFTLASLSWMTVNAYQMYRSFTNLFDGVKAHTIFTYLLAYGIPYLFVFVNFSVTIWYLDLPYDPADVCFESKYRARFMCWLQPPSLYYGFLLPFGILLLFNYFVFAVLLKKVIFRKKKVRPSTRNKLSKEKERKNQLLNTITMVTMMGLTWIFGYFLLIADNVTYQTIMQWLFIVFNVFQGVLIFYMSCLRLASVRAVWIPCSKSASQASNGTNTIRSRPSPMIGQSSGAR